MKYVDEMKRTMDWLAEKKEVIFLGQAVAYPGTAMSNTFADIPKEKLLEMPVCEEFQMGLSIGLALDGMIPISVYPRWNFLLLATNQIVNHLDKIPVMADRPFMPGVIIKVSIGSERPIHPQHQHVGNYSEAFRSMCDNIKIYELKEPEEIFSTYRNAYYAATHGNSSILVEYGDYYNEK